MKRTVIIFSAVLCMISIQSLAQNSSGNYASGINVSGHVQLGLPQNEFKEILNGYPAGAGVSFSTPMGSTGLLRLGGEFAWNTLGDEKTLVELYDDASNILGGDMTSTTNVRNYLGYVRVMPFKGRVRPYGDVILGLRSYKSEANIEVDNVNGNYSSTNIDLIKELKSTYGYALGLNFALGNNVFLDSKVQILRGGKVTYVDQESLEIDVNGDINYSLQVSDTDIVIPQVGLSVYF
jgi:opacity protein-like surface antigen